MRTHNADLLVIHAAELLTCRGGCDGIRGAQLRQLDVIADGALAIGHGRILAVGPTGKIARAHSAPRTLDASGRLVTPGLVDSHSHLVFGGTRHRDYEAKVTQCRVPEPLDSGIRYTVRMTRETADAQLIERASADLDLMLAHGTTTLEAKTGYGLSCGHELRLLRLTAGLRHPLDVVPTFLGLHVLPEDYVGRREEWIAAIIDTLPQAAGVARYCDVACDPLCFTYEECLRVATAARARGMKIRVHADQTGDARGALLAARLESAAADHLDYASAEGLQALARSGTVATLLPGVTLHLCEMTPSVRAGALGPAEKPFMPLLARQAIDAGAIVGLATDYNPGSCPNRSMQMVMQLAARLYRLSYAEIWHMSTLNAACALDLADDRGSLQPGKRADVLVWSVPEHGMAIDQFGVNLVDTVIVAGRIVAEAGLGSRRVRAGGQRACH
jgi:imidazolonepropionase